MSYSKRIFLTYFTAHFTTASTCSATNNDTENIPVLRPTINYETTTTLEATTSKSDASGIQSFSFGFLYEN